MKAVIIFHSVCGNCYLMANEFQRSLKKNGIYTDLYRVDDTDLEKWTRQFICAEEYYEEIIKLPVATTDVLLRADLIIIGSPTYFANMSAEMKAFLDSTCIYFSDNLLLNKKFACFTSASASESGGSFCLQTLINYAMNNGMLPISIPTAIQFQTGCSPYGIVQISGGQSDQRPDINVMNAIRKYSGLLAGNLKTN